MLKFSEIHNKMDADTTDELKSEFMSQAQSICAESKHIARYTGPLIDACTDIRLKSQLSKDIEHLNSLAQQFKILSAVKASSTDDSDREAQLIICAKNITRCGKSILNNCRSASLRCREGTPHIIFTEAVYRKRY